MEGVIVYIARIANGGTVIKWKASSPNITWPRLAMWNNERKGRLEYMGVQKGDSNGDNFDYDIYYEYM